MVLKRRLVIQATILLAASTLAAATVRHVRRETQLTPAEQAVRVRAVERRPTKAPEQPPQAADTQREHLTVSPDQKRAIYHMPFDPYRARPEPVVFVAADNETGRPIRKIPVRWPARYVASVEWANDRAVLVRGEARYLTVLDIDAGQQTHNLIGYNFALSPDGTQIVYSHDFNPRYGEIPPEYQSDYVLFSLVDRRPDSGRINGRYDSNNYRVIYPTSLPWGEGARQTVESPADRRQIKGTFVWSPDGRQVAFVESQTQKLWLVVLGPTDGVGDIAINSRRFELGDGNRNISSISWAPDGGRITVVGDETSLSFDIRNTTK
jgi:hypothetical protein